MLPKEPAILIKDKNKAAVIIPSHGFSQLDAQGNPFYNHKCVKAIVKSFGGEPGSKGG